MFGMAMTVLGQDPGIQGWDPNRVKGIFAWGPRSSGDDICDGESLNDVRLPHQGGSPGTEYAPPNGGAPAKPHSNTCSRTRSRESHEASGITGVLGEKPDLATVACPVPVEAVQPGTGSDRYDVSAVANSFETFNESTGSTDASSTSPDRVTMPPSEANPGADCRENTLWTATSLKEVRLHESSRNVEL